MKNFSTVLLALVLTIGIAVSSQDAEAKRLGGGMSSGMKRDSGIMKRDAAPTPSAPSQAAPRPAAPTPTPAPAPSGMSRWLGPLAGLAAGIGIASLFSHFGMGEGMGSLLMMLLIGGAIFFVVRMLMRRSATPADSVQYAGAGNNAPVRFEPQVMPSGSAVPLAASINIPAGFDVDGFVRQAKLNFVRLQAANDAGNMEDIRAFTTPEMFAEVQMEYQERGKTVQQTDVVELNAGLLDLSTEGNRQIASVRFFGLIRETPNAAPEAFDEVWHLARPADASSGWVIAGIQQFS
ncbi:MAG: TIM44-like domain-containing protein [Betaproteobacteria bacterium]|nr:TIM44-like domain-containing protein [Betaproteobacteria bacterium]